MSDALRHAAAKRIAGLFGALSRIELAASRLARENLTPSARELLGAVREAASELDEGVNEALLWLTPAVATTRAAGELGPVLRDLAQRFAPVLAARDRTLRPCLDPASRATGDPEFVRRIATRMLRAAAQFAGCGGAITLGIVEGPARSGVEASWTRAGAGFESRSDRARTSAERDLDGELTEVEAICMAGGCAFERVDGDQSGRLVVWLAARPDSVATRVDAR